jgi:hypothetical protein
MPKQVWVKTARGIRGPCSLERIREDASAGNVRPDDEISTDRCRWFPAVELAGLEFLPERNPLRYNTLFFGFRK